MLAGAGSYASAQAFSDGFVAAMGVASALSLLGALCGAALPGRRSAGALAPPSTAPALQADTR
ncbi:MAG: hypothetical protein H0U06_08675 [Solirubrobacterales bacterium]|nr:hypothetical protein [Solirubrobacterales bacterium]